MAVGWRLADATAQTIAAETNLCGNMPQPIAYLHEGSQGETEARIDSLTTFLFNNPDFLQK